MALPATTNLSAYRGDTWSQRFRFLNGAVPVNLTGATVEAAARVLVGGTGVTPLVVQIEDAVDGKIILSLPPGGLPVGIYQYDVEVTLSGVVTTWVRGQLSVVRDVTNEQ